MTTHVETEILTLLGVVQDDIKEMKADNREKLHGTPCADLQILKGQIRVLWSLLCAAGAVIAWLVSVS